MRTPRLNGHFPIWRTSSAPSPSLQGEVRCGGRPTREMLPPTREWPETWPPQVPSAFSSERARQNADYLEQCLGAAWIRKGVARGAPHQFLQDWRWGGLEAFLRLNALAEDLRVLEGTAGLPSVLAELKTPKQSQPTSHTIHTAALFRRAGNNVSRFYNPKNDSLPDFELQVQGDRIPAEAKQLTQSEPERLFSSHASLLQEALLNSVLIEGTNHPELRIVIKDGRHFPTTADIINAVREGLRARSTNGASQHGFEFRSPLFNAFLLAPPPFGDVTDAVSLQIVAPRDDKEDDRVERLLNKANKQLKRNTNGEEPALMCLALGRHQDPHAVAALIHHKFNNGDFRSTSGVILHSFANQEGPQPKTVVDLISYISNPNARRSVGAITLEGVGITGSLLDNTPIDATTSCYGVGIARGRIAGNNATIGLSPLFRLPSSMLT